MWLDAYNGCSYTADTIHIEFVQSKIDLGSDTLICKRERLEIGTNLNHINAAYQWSTGDTSTFITVGDSGLYWQNGRIGNCSDSDSIYIRYHVPDNSILEQIDTMLVFCLSDTIKAPASQWQDSYEWNTGESNRVLFVEESGSYEVYAENECTESISTYEINVESLNEGLNDYNIFTPNEDGANELFTIYEGNSRKYSLQIYNRWGRLIWQTDDPMNYWDGGEVSDGLYYYQISFLNCNNDRIERNGHVTVVK